MIMFGMTKTDRKWKYLQDTRRCSVESPLRCAGTGTPFSASAVLKRWASSAKGPRDSTATGIKYSWMTNRCTWQTSSLQRSPLPFRPELHFVPHKKQPACGQQSRPMWRCVLNATVPKSDHLAFFCHLCWDFVAPWMMVFRLLSEHDGSGRWSEHDAVPCQGFLL